MPGSVEILESTDSELHAGVFSCQTSCLRLYCTTARLWELDKIYLQVNLWKLLEKGFTISRTKWALKYLGGDRMKHEPWDLRHRLSRDHLHPFLLEQNICKCNLFSIYVHNVQKTQIDTEDFNAISHFNSSMCIFFSWKRFLKKVTP